MAGEALNVESQWLVRTIRPGAYRPDKLIRGLEQGFSGGEPTVAGFHLFTFNELAATEAWRRERLARV